MPAKKTSKEQVGAKLDKLINTIREATEEFNAIHVEHIPREAPSSASAHRLRIEVKHLNDIKMVIEERIKKDESKPGKE